KLIDININKLHQPWRSFAAIINKCLTGKSSGYDSLRLSQAQILWGLYHKRNVDFAYLMWEDFVYQLEHKDTKKSNEMYYPRFTKVIIHHFMSKDPSNLRRNKVNWHYVRDNHMFTTIKLVSRHQNTQQFGALLPIELTNEDIRNSNAYQEYYAVATGATPPKPKASVWKTRSSSDTTTPPLTTAAGPRLTTSEKGKQAAKASKAKSLSALFEVAMTEAQQLKEDISWKSTNDKGDEDEGNDGGDDDDDGNDGEEGDGDDDDEQASDEEEFIHPSLSTHTKEEPMDEERKKDTMKRKRKMNYTETSILIKEGSSSVSSQFVTSMLNPTPDAGMKSIFETTSQMDVQTLTSMAPLPMTAPTITPSTIATITTTRQVPLPPIIALSTLIKDLPNFGSLFGFDNRLRTLKANFLEFMQTNQFAGAVSSIPTITSYAVAADLSEMDLKKIRIKKMEGNKSIHRFNEQRNLYKALIEAYESDKIILDTYGDTVTLKRHRDDDADKEEEPSAGSDWGSKRHREGKEPESASDPKEKSTRSAGKSTQGSKSRQTSASESATAEEPMQTTFEMEEPSHPEFEIELLAGPTYELMKGSYKSLVELKFLLEEVYKVTTDKLDLVNPEGQQYPHNLLKPLPLIPNNRGRRVIPFNHFINNDLEYLHGGASSRKYTTSVTKTKAADYGHIKESAHDVYSKRKIIPVTELKIVEWLNYKHLDWITLTNLTVKERFAFNVSIRMFTRSIVIQRRVEDLQLGVESYQKKLNLTRPDTYRTDLKRKVAYSAYSNPRGFIYQNKDKEKRLIRIDELQKLSNGTLTDVRTALDDRLKGIRMKYLPQSICRKSDKDRVAAMIQAIDKRLKTWRIMRSLKRRVEDLQLGVESYQKKLNLTKPDSYRSDLKHKEAYTAYFNPRGFIYQNKDTKNRLMRIDELHKFSDGTLTDVRTALDDRLKWIWM
nr:hypothetical protein [Tanacetum cinerariifolium]